VCDRPGLGGREDRTGFRTDAGTSEPSRSKRVGSDTLQMHRRRRVSVGRGGAKGGEMVKGSDG